jgi:tetratricopeptide (TPR) repeat protein
MIRRTYQKTFNLNCFTWILASFVLMMTPHYLYADQNNPRLNELFLELKNILNPSKASTLEKKIWDIWLKNPRPELSYKLKEGTQAMQTQDFEKALEYFSELTLEAPEFAEAWNKRATVLFMMGRSKESLIDVERTLKLEPRHFGALSGKGLILMQFQDWSGAIKAFQDGLKIHPFMKASKKHLEYVIKKQKESLI